MANIAWPLLSYAPKPKPVPSITSLAQIFTLASSSIQNFVWNFEMTDPYYWYRLEQAERRRAEELRRTVVVV